MKANRIFAAIVSILFAPAALAGTHYQEDCSNAEGTVVTALGVDRDFIKVFDGNGMVDLSPAMTSVLVQDAVSMKRVERAECAPGAEEGLAIVEEYEAREIVLRKADGSAFEGAMPGLETGARGIRAMLICKRTITSDAPCH